tara:strand:- start:41299 stop:43575 length:2277 start_codon:yes stop_codon:yes gene_type:complete
MMYRWFLLSSVLILTGQCVSGELQKQPLPAEPPGFSQAQEIRPAIVWQESEDSATLTGPATGFLAPSSREISHYNEWLQKAPRDCSGYDARDYWARRSYPVFVRWHNTYGKPVHVEKGQSDEGDFARIFVSFRNAGLLISDDGGQTFHRPESQPMRYVGEKEGECDPPLYRDVVGIWQHPRDSRIILAVNIQDILLSRDGGKTFTALDFKGLSGLKSRNIFASVAASVDGKGKVNQIFLGTAYNGVKRLSIQGNLELGPIAVRVSDFNAGLPGLLHEPGVTFYEHILDLRWLPTTETLIAATLFDPGVATASTRPGSSGFSFRRVPGAATDAVNESMDCDTRGCLLIGTEGSFFFDLQTGDLMPVDRFSGRVSEDRSRVSESKSAHRSENGQNGHELETKPTPFQSLALGPYLVHEGPMVSLRPAPKTEVKRPEVLSAFYVSPTSARIKQPLVFSLIERYGFNAVVIDVKDDFGRLLYGSELPMAREMNNDREIAPVRALVKKFKEHGIYTIARQVVFKDLRMHKYKGHRNAIKNRYSGGPWTVEGDEQWTDPFSQEVQAYNLAVAREVLELGFDEIQFDYIRFPSDGPIYQCLFSHAPEGAYRTEAIESFLRRARFSLKAPISIDIFGYNGIYRAGAVIGQDVLEMGSSVDFVSPMHYSSHFGTHYLNHYPRDTRVHRLLELGTERPLRMSRGLFSIRPWLQAFPMMNHIWGYGYDYMAQQMQGSLDGGATGFLFWGPIAEFPIAGQAYRERIRRQD